MYTDRLVTGGKTGEVERGRLIEQQRTDMQASSYRRPRSDAFRNSWPLRSI